MLSFPQFTRSALREEFAWVEAIIFEGDLMVRKQFFGGQFSSVVIVRGKANFPRKQLPGRQMSGGQLSSGAIFQAAIIRGPIIQRAIVQGAIIWGAAIVRTPIL